MEDRYVTFGRSHRHEINGKVFDENCVALVHGGRAKVFEIFGNKFSFDRTKEEMHDDGLTFKLLYYFPRGIIDVQKD